MPNDFELTAAEIAIEEAMTAHPTLTSYGFSPTARESFEVCRERLMQPQCLDGVALALAFLRACGKKRKTVNYRHHAYGLKHTAERWAREHSGRHPRDCYIYEGTFVVAALHMGYAFSVTRTGTRFALSLRRGCL